MQINAHVAINQLFFFITLFKLSNFTSDYLLQIVCICNHLVLNIRIGDIAAFF